MTDGERRGRAKRAYPLHVQIFVALFLAVLLGFALGDTEWGRTLVPVLDFAGQLFLRMLKMLVLPLIFSSIIVGVAGVGEQRGVGKMGLLTIALYVSTSLVAILTGLGSVLLIRPGVVDGKPARELIGLTADLNHVLGQVEGRGAQDLWKVFLRMVPENVLADAAAGEMLSTIVFAIAFGLAINGIESRPRDTIVSFFRAVDQVMLRLTGWVLLVSPAGVFALVAKVVLTTGWGAVRPLGWFVLAVFLGLFVHAFLVLPLLLVTLARLNPRVHFRAMTPALLMAFSTASSSGTLPVTIQSVQKVGVSEKVASFTLPLGATVNMDGTALYECVAAIFIAQAYGIQLSFQQLFIVVASALLTSVGVAGIPAASLVAISLILTAIGLPLEGLGLILAVDRVLDMCRTSVNVLGDSVVAVCVDRVTRALAPSPDPEPS